MRKVALLLLVLVVSVVAGCGSGAPSPSGDTGVAPEHSMKGYELYSWETGGEWHLSLLVGTNRLKSAGEITSQAVSVDVIIDELERLPAGEYVFWRQPDGMDLSFPPEPIIDRITESCELSGIRLVITRGNDTG